MYCTGRMSTLRLISSRELIIENNTSTENVASGEIAVHNALCLRIRSGNMRRRCNGLECTLADSIDNSIAGAQLRVRARVSRSAGNSELARNRHRHGTRTHNQSTRTDRQAVGSSQRAPRGRPCPVRSARPT